MRIDNSARGSSEFVKMLAKQKEDGNVSREELIGLLHGRIDGLLKNGESLKPLSLALQQQMQQSQQTTVTEAILQRQERSKSSEIIDKLESED